MDVDQPYDSDEASLSASNEYPDFDFVPRYPWRGNEDSGSSNIDGSALYSRNSLVPRISNTLEPDIQQVSTRVHDGTDLDGSLLDADYHFREDSALSDELISEAESDFHSLEKSSNGARGSRRGKRGRPRGRGRAGRGRGGRGARGGKGIRRGPRKALEPTQEFKTLHSQATVAFIDHDYDLAEDYVQQAIGVNPEMFSAHALLSEIHAARGDQNKALTALFNGVHTRPRDTEAWCKVAELILERAGDDRSSGVRDAVYCYNRVIGANSTHVEARYRRAELNREMGHRGKAAYDYERLLKHLPHDTVVLRHLAEIYIDLDDVERAIKHYDESISHYESVEPWEVKSLTWSDINVYLELYNYSGQYSLGISRLKSLSRWLLGRRQDTFWNDYRDDDREFDADDHGRRLEVELFVPGKYGPTTYGQGLPLELRVKLGLFRLNLGAEDLEEAMNHFHWLVPNNDGYEAKVFDYPDLFRDVADALRTHDYHGQALLFYLPLHQVDEYANVTYFSDMAVSYQKQGLASYAEDCYKKILDLDDSSMEARFELAKIYRDSGMPEQASAYMSDVVFMRRRVQSPRKTMGATESLASGISTLLAPRIQKSKTNSMREKKRREKEPDEVFLASHVQMLELKRRLRAGHDEAKAQWMEIAKDFIEDFRDNRVFFPLDKYVKFYGYTKEARARSGRSKAIQDIEEPQMAAERCLSLAELGDDAEPVPTDYRGIHFNDWLDIFLEYSIFAAQEGHSSLAYETITTASDANVFYHSPDSILLIHVAWFSCALILNDPEILCSISRFFMKDYQFVTDSYRIFYALNRLCDNASWFNAGPSQKFILRQVKAMDFSFLGEERRKRLFQEKASYTTKDELGNPVLAEEMDIALIMLYGHILYTGTSYSYALNYFFRAYALDPKNPMINLSLALGYIHHALKRQAANRHYLLMQGFAFLFAYYDFRQGSKVPSERQEAEFNVGRAYHMLGLVHLAIPYYERCLDLSYDVQRNDYYCTLENFARDAAFALQGIWAAGGQFREAQAITEKWLKI